MNSICRFLIVPATLLFACSVFGQTDSVVKIRHTMAVTPSRANEGSVTVLVSAYYVHAKMRRIDTLDAAGNVTFTRINNCDKRSGLIVDPIRREYRAIKLPRTWTEQQFLEYIDKNPGNVVPVESRTVDTGDKKTFLGMVARHFITTIERPVKDGVGGSETIDAWYVEHEKVECQMDGVLDSELSGAMLATYPEMADTHHTGPIPRGLPVQVQTVIKWTGGVYGPNGRTLKSERVVESISDSALNSKIFEVPAGFRENANLLKH